MSGPRATDGEYTGKHRRNSGPGVKPPAWPVRAESYGLPGSYARPADARPGSGAAARPGLSSGSGFRPERYGRPEAGQWPDAG